MKRLFCLLTAVLLFFESTYCVGAAVSVSAQSAVVIDCSTKRVLFEKDAHTKRGMASTTKIMTALIALEKLDLSDVVVVSPHAAGVEGSSIWLEPMEKITVEDLLYGLLLASGNDAASALAEHTAGSEEAFAVLMNKKAVDIGAYNTHFTNPHGLNHENHYTTAYDLALISACAMENELFAEMVATKHKTISWEGSEWDRSLTNHNKLLTKYEYAVGIKTGYTKKDGRCLVSCAEKDGRRFVCVSLNAPDDWNDHIRLLEDCFEKYEAYEVCRKGDSAGLFSNEDAEDIRALYKNDFITSLTDTEKERIKKKKVFNVNYPVYQGDVVGREDILLNDELIGSVDLIAGNNSEIKKNLGKIIEKLAKGILRL